MTVLNGYLINSSEIFGLDNPNISAQLSQFSLDVWPPYVSAQPALSVGALITPWPVEANSHTVSGFVVKNYFDDYYNRVHINPSQLDLGNVVSTQTSSVKVWNAFLSAVTLTTINGVDEGIELSGQSAPPLTFTALQERTWQVAITPDGSAVINAALEWAFSNGSLAKLGITGNRISAFPFLPDWADGITERLVWATDILQSSTGAEQRRALRLAPRRTFEVQLFLDGRERQAFDLAMFGWNARVWAMPIWPDAQRITASLAAGVSIIACDTVNRDFRANGLAILLGENAFQYETVEVLSITSTQLTLKRALVKQWPAGTRLYPVRTARLEQAPQLSRQTDQFQKIASVSFNVVEPCEWTAVLPATVYRGYPVFDAVPDESEDLTSQFKHLTLLLDNGSAIPRTTETAKVPAFINQYRWFLNGRTERAAFRSLIYALKGRQVAIWISTHAEDLTLAAIVVNTATTMDIVNIGYTRYGQARVGRRDIRIQLRSGTVFYRRITGSTEINADVERLQIDSSFGVQINLADVLRISFLILVRQDSDSIEIQHETDSAGLATSQQLFKGVRDDDI